MTARDVQDLAYALRMSRPNNDAPNDVKMQYNCTVKEIVRNLYKSHAHVRKLTDWVGVFILNP